VGADDEQTLIIPVFPLELTLLPGEPQVLRIYEPRYKQMLDDCLLDEAPFGLCLIDPFHPITGWAGPHLVGTTARITEHEEVGSNHMIEIQGQRRFRILKLIEPSLPPMDPVQHRVFPDLESLLQLVDDEEEGRLYIRAEVEFLSEPQGALKDELKCKLEEEWLSFLDILGNHNGMSSEILEEWKGAQLATVNDWDAAALWRIASVMVMDANDKQSLLESEDIDELAGELLNIFPKS
jgi:Lon protease-like protein